MPFVYVLWSDKLKKRYVGTTGNVEQRVREHNTGKTPFTKSGMPWDLLYTEEYATTREARMRERYLKSGVGRKWLDEQLGHRKSGNTLN